MTGIFDALDATWPAAATHPAGSWLVRDGRGGGKRVSAATATEDGAAAHIDAAEAAHKALGQPPIFCLRGGQDVLDQALAARSYRTADPVVIYAAPAGRLTGEPPARLSTFPIWPPLAIMKEVWAEGGIGPARLAVMDRVIGPKVSILGRAGDRAAGAGFVAMHDNTAVIHALHVLPDQRHKGLARNIMRAAALWASDQGADQIALAVTKANDAANALYTALGMTIIDQYHYRVK